jgi:hypothetical protein
MNIDSQDTMIRAFTELVEDTTALSDPALIEDDQPYAAVTVSMERDSSGYFYIDVKLRQIEGSQLAFVLSVARKYELEAREEEGWLRLSRHFTSEDFAEEPDPEVVEA